MPLAQVIRREFQIPQTGIASSFVKCRVEFVCRCEFVGLLDYVFIEFKLRMSTRAECCWNLLELAIKPDAHQRMDACSALPIFLCGIHGSKSYMASGTSTPSRSSAAVR